MSPLPMLHNKPSILKLTLSRLSIVLTIVFWLFYIFSTIIRQLIDNPQSYGFTMEAFSYSFVVSILTFSSLMYLIARHGALETFRKHSRVPRAVLDKFYSKNQPAVTVLIPSYREEYSIIRKTLLSVALQEYPKLRVVLLIDDNPNPNNKDDKKLLEQTRMMGKEIENLFIKPYKHFLEAYNRFERDHRLKRRISNSDIEGLINNYKWASDWLRQFADNEIPEDHVDVFFINQVLLSLARDLDLVGHALSMSINEGGKIPRERVKQLYLRLVWTFHTEFETFERKKYASLSHEANKAMNLNAYIGLMGGTYRKENTPNGTVLIPTKGKSHKNIIIPDSEFLITLDADSILLREYCMRLVYFLEQRNNQRVAVTQTPYSSFRGAFSRIERLAGATTDTQHILHQGMSHYGAAFWVGANAVIRKSALKDIEQKEWNGEFEVKRYIQDRTVIEDTESSIDLGLHDWKIINYPERLSYSATPPDFGSLVVQRRRWANGGLLILPKLFAQIAARKRKNNHVSRTEVFLKLNYMASIAWSTFGLIFLLAYPYDGRLLSPLVLLAALPYFIAMASDLKYNRYHYFDIFSIYGFNLIMLPVNLTGVLKSIEQAFTGKKIPFARTPKVKNRTRSSIEFVTVPLLIVAFSLFTVWRNALISNWGNAAFAAFNATLATWAIFVYIGVDNLIVDVWHGVIDWLYVENKTSKNDKTEDEQYSNWRAVLYNGETNSTIPYSKN